MHISLPEGFIQSFIIPLMPVLAGGIKFVVDYCLSSNTHSSWFAGQHISELPSNLLVPLLPSLQQKAYVNTLTTARYWTTNIQVLHNWRTHYDGPTVAQCAWATSYTPDYFQITARSVSIEVGGQYYYAQHHVSLVQMGVFARVTSAKSMQFLESRDI